MPLQHLIGTQAFLPALVAHIRSDITSSPLPLDHVIFQSILLCVIAGDKHLILRTPEEDVALTVKLVVWTLSCIFDLSTRKLKIRPRNAISRPSSKPTNAASDAVAFFLRSLFLPAPSSESNFNQTSQDQDEEGSASETVKHGKHRRSHTPKQASSSSSSPKSRPAPDYTRARSYPYNAVNPPIIRTTSPESMLMQSSIQPHIQPESNPTGILKPTPIYPPNHNTMPGMLHAFTDPLPLPPPHRKKSGSRSSYAKQPLHLPQALVVYGLENGSDAVHRAFAKVLGDKKVILQGYNQKKGGSDIVEQADDVWSLSDDFIVVYVCPWNARERPGIHKTLLDKFAMSSNVFISQGVRRDFNLMSFSPSVPPQPFHSNDISHSNPASPTPAYQMALPQTQTYTPPIFNKSLPLHRVHPSSPTSFSVPSQSVKPAKTPLRPSLMKALRDAYHRVYFSPDLMLYLSDIFSAARQNSRLDGMLLTARAVKDAQDLVKASRVVGSDMTGGELLRPHAYKEDESTTSEDEGSSSFSNDSRRDDEGTGVDDDDLVYQDARSTFDLGEERQGLLQKTADEDASVASDRAPDDAYTSQRVLDVSEVHVARIVPRVVSHRLRVRDGPEDEVLASALFGATFSPPPRSLTADAAVQKIEGEKPLSVKNVLVQILAEV